MKNTKPFRRSPPLTLTELGLRVTRIESRLVALMKHVGMTTDGRRELPPPHQQKEAPK